uniref:Zinc knuckle CX2CX4HX4C domain-containing protein n=1 Tax=Quercus lobata TaxID=97700 RepID=A0A7N2MN61_QUELO
MQRYDKSKAVEKLGFDKTLFWVQVRGLPYHFMNVKATRKICEVLGQVIHSTDPTESEGGNFMRIRVMMDVSLPLCRGRVISMENGKTMWISFKCEQLPNICYWCGRLEYDDRDYNLWLESEGRLTEDQKQFGPSLHAAPFALSRKTVISVPRLYESKLGSSSKYVHHETEKRAESVVMNNDAPIPDSDPAKVNSQDSPGHVTHQQLRDETVTMDSGKVTHNVREYRDDPINDFSIDPLISGIHYSKNQGTMSLPDLFDAKINGIDSELSKFDPIKDPVQYSNISQDAISKSREKQEQDKSLQFQHKWTRLARKDTENEKQKNAEKRGEGSAETKSAEKRVFSTDL